MCDSNCRTSASPPNGFAKFWHLYTSAPGGTSNGVISRVTVLPGAAPEPVESPLLPVGPGLPVVAPAPAPPVPDAAGWSTSPHAARPSKRAEHENQVVGFMEPPVSTRKTATRADHSRRRPACRL